MTDTTDLKAEYERLKVIIGDANPDEIIEYVFFDQIDVVDICWSQFFIETYNFRRENSKLVSNQENLPEFEEAPTYKPPQQHTQKSTKSN